LVTKNEPYGLYIFPTLHASFPGLHCLSRDRLVSAAFYFRDCTALFYRSGFCFF
jgi:hypothetical protein